MMYSSNGGYGDYRINWFDNGRLDGQSEFTISKTTREKISDLVNRVLSPFHPAQK
jgi:hypothetical protein